MDGLADNSLTAAIKEILLKKKKLPKKKKYFKFMVQWLALPQINNT